MPNVVLPPQRGGPPGPPGDPPGPPRPPGPPGPEQPVSAELYRALRDEHAHLVARLDELTRALDASHHENHRLQRELGHLAAENHELRRRLPRHPVTERAPATDRHSHIRRMLSERSSRNP